MTPLRLLVAEDHPLVAEALVETIGRMPGLLAAGRVADLDDIPPALHALAPDVLLLDLHLRRIPSWPRCPGYRRLLPRLRIVGISAVVPPPDALPALDGFVSKLEFARELPALFAAPGSAPPPIPPAPVPPPLVARAAREARLHAADLRASVERRDPGSAVHFAHALKNSVDLLGRDALSDLGQRLHDRCVLADWPGALRALDALSAALPADAAA